MCFILFLITWWVTMWWLASKCVKSFGFGLCWLVYKFHVCFMMNQSIQLIPLVMKCKHCETFPLCMWVFLIYKKKKVDWTKRLSSYGTHDTANYIHVKCNLGWNLGLCSKSSVCHPKICHAVFESALLLSREKINIVLKYTGYYAYALFTNSI